MQKVLLFSRDPGGANVIIPLAEKLNGKYEVTLLGKEFALQKYKDNNIEFVDINALIKNITVENIETYLKQIKPHFIITATSLNDFTERYLWKAAKKLNIPSFAIIDQWMNLGIRFSNYSYAEIDKYNKNKNFMYMPSKIIVMDKVAFDEIIEEGISKEKVLIGGQPHFDSLIKKYNNISNVRVEMLKKQMKLEDNFIFLFASEPISIDYDNENSEELYWGFSEKTSFDNLYRECINISRNTNKKFTIIVRPHPRENITYWKKMVNLNNDNNVKIQVDTQNSSLMLIKMADCICGMSSMFLIESVLCKKPIITIMIGLKQKNPFILDEKMIVSSIITLEELEIELNKAINNKLDLVKFEVIVDATDKIIEFMEDIIQ